MSIENISIEEETGTFFTPAVEFNAETGICRIEGESYLEDTFNFYAKLRDWVNDFFESGKSALELNFKFRYFNTSSSRAILDLLKTLKKHQEGGKTVGVKWHYPDPDDIEMMMEGEDFESDSGLTFEYVPYPEEE